MPPLRQFGQGYKSMSPGDASAFEERVLNRRLVHGGNPLLTWAVSNVALERDAAGNVKPSKERSRERIDPAVAAIMAVGLAAAQEPKVEPSRCPTRWCFLPRVLARSPGFAGRAILVCHLYDKGEYSMNTRSHVRASRRDR